MRKKILAVVICILMLAALLPVTAYAAPATTVKIAGTTLVEGTAYKNNGANTGIEETASEWNAYYENGVLSLSGLNVTGSAATVGGDGGLTYTYAVYANGDLIIDLTGTNTVSSAAGEYSAAAYIDGSLTVRSSAGGGTLTATAAESDIVSSGIWATGALTVQSGTVTAIGGDAQDPVAAVYAGGALEVSGGSLSGTAGSSDSFSCGVQAVGAITVSGEGELTGAGGDTTGIDDGTSFGVYGATVAVSGSGSVTGYGNGGGSDDSYGVVAGGNISAMDEGEIIGVGGEDTGDSRGVAAGISMGPTSAFQEIGAITVSGGSSITGTGNAATRKSIGVSGSGITGRAGGTIEGIGGTTSSDPNNFADSYGVYVYEGNITVLGESEINGTGGMASGDGDGSYGVYVTAYDTGGNITVSSGSLTGIGGGAVSDSTGVCAWKTVTVSGGSLEGTGGNATGQWGDSTGVSAGAIRVSGGSLTGTGKAVSGKNRESCGVYICENSTVSGGSVTATGGTASGEHGISAGLYAEEDEGGLTVTVSGGNVTGTSNQMNGIGVASKYDVTIAVRSGSLTAQGRAGAVSELHWVETDPETEAGYDELLAGSVTLGSGVTAIMGPDYDGPGETNYISGIAIVDQVKYFHAEGTAQPPRTGGSSDAGDDIFYSRDELVKVRATAPSGNVAITAMEKDSANFLLLSRGQNDAPVLAYDIDAAHGGEAIIMFFVGRENAGKEYTVLHKLADGSIEEFHCTCAANGWITVRVKEFSPFMVFAGSVGGGRTAAGTAYVENPDTGANDAVALASALGALALIGCCAVSRKR